MSVNNQSPTTTNETQEKAPDIQQINLQKQRVMYERMLAEKEAQLQEARKAVEQQNRHQAAPNDDDDDDEPYIDKKKLEKKLNKFGEQSRQQTQSEIQKAVQMALAEERKQNWIKSNSDFHEVLQHAEKLAQRNPELAETILEMPDTFERQKLVYRQIKAMGLDKPEQPKSNIQDTIDRNRRSPYYQPTGISPAPYAAAGDFSPVGQKQAFEKMQELKSKLRLG